MTDNNKVLTTKNGLMAAALGMASMSALAVPVTVSQTVSLSQLLSGNSTGVQFNVSSLLAIQGMNNGDITSGTLVVYGLSDININSTTASPYSGYQTTQVGTHQVQYTYWVPERTCSTWNWSCNYQPGHYATDYRTGADYEQVRTFDVRRVDNVADVMAVRAGNTTVTDTADQRYSYTEGYGGYNYEGQYSNGDAIYRQYNRQRNVYEAVHGALNTSMSLDVAALLDLSSDGLLDTFVNAQVGQFRLLSATLTVNAEKAISNGVPEPSILGLGGIGLAAAALARRRRRLRA